MALLLCACSPHPEQMAKPSYWLNSDLDGPDADHNGIRDDVDAWIAAQPFTVPQKRAAEQFARSMQISMVTEYKTKKDTRQMGEQIGRSVDCLASKFDQPGHILDAIMSETLNTKARILKQDANDEMASGMGFEVSQGNTCE